MKPIKIDCCEWAIVLNIAGFTIWMPFAIMKI